MVESAVIRFRQSSSGRKNFAPSEKRPVDQWKPIDLHLKGNRGWYVNVVDLGPTRCLAMRKIRKSFRTSILTFVENKDGLLNSKAQHVPQTGLFLRYFQPRMSTISATKHKLILFYGPHMTLYGHTFLRIVKCLKLGGEFHDLSTKSSSARRFHVSDCVWVCTMSTGIVLGYGTAIIP